MEKDTWEAALHEKLIEALHQKIAEEEGIIKNEYSGNNQEVIEHFLFPARRNVIKGFCDTLTSVVEAVIEQYPNEYYWRYKTHYPHAWMTNDNRINAKLKDFKIVEVLNYLFEINHGIKGDDFKVMTALADRLTDKKKHNNKHAYSVFVVNKQFYEKAMKALSLTQRTLQKYLQTFCDAGIISAIGRIGNEAVYCDGFFVAMRDGKLRKFHFLKNEPEYRKALRNFNYNSG